jgi:glycerol-3-phosphate dehydrogenase (NAD(P)+)
MKLAVLGAGAWGTAVSISLASRHEVRLWARDRVMVDGMVAARVNARYLPDVAILPQIAITAKFEEAIAGCELILVATTTAGLRSALRQIAGAGAGAPVIWLCKGFESGTAKLPHEIAAAELPPETRRGALSGPSFAQEVARGLPTALTLACSDGDFASRCARELHAQALRIYSSDDLPGVEVAGAVKNVMAIASGISDGLGLGANARAALVTRGLAEITRLGLKLGGRIETFMGLTGVGDLILTCTGDLSRNRRVGLKLAQGFKLDAVLHDLGHVAEGVYTAREVKRIADSLAIDMPITRAVCRVLDESVSARDAVQELLRRDPKAEF